MGAIQAQNYRMMRWSVMMRMKRPSLEDFREAYNKGKIVRLHLLRGTWQLVAAEDYWWMMELFAHKAETTIRGWMKSNRVEIDEDELLRVRDILSMVCYEKGSATKEDFAKALSLHNMSMDAHRLSYHLRLAEISGTLCSGNLSPLRATYALVAQKLNKTVCPNRDEMLTILARKYFVSHSPATLEDYVWWSGLTMSDCRKGISLLNEELQCHMWNGREFYLHNSCRTRGFRRGHLLLLPPYDEYLVGYKSRDIVLFEKYASRAYTRNGIFFPVVVHDGMVCGNWSLLKDFLELDMFQSMPITDGTVLDKQRKALLLLGHEGKRI